jgi:uncharacterized protein (DUF1330 family)
MTEETKPAYFVVCGTTLGGTVDPEYGRLASPAAAKAELKPIAGGEVGTPQVEVLEGELPPGTTFLAIEQFPSMAVLKEFYFSKAYQSAIPFRLDSIRMNFLAAVDGISDAELEERAKAAAVAADEA